MAMEYKFEIPKGGFVTAQGDLRRLADRLLLDISDRAASRAKTAIRRDMSGAGLGKLGNAIGSTSDKIKGRGVFRRGDVSRASGVVFIRSKSPRTVGAIISYTEGATITAKNSPWLWIPTDAVQRLVGSPKQGNRTRMTPGIWKERGFDKKIGPLVRIRSVNGNPLLAVQNVGVSAVAGGRRRVRSLTKSGRARKGDQVSELQVLFIGIRRTKRSARVNVRKRAFEAVQQASAQVLGV